MDIKLFKFAKRRNSTKRPIESGTGATPSLTISNAKINDAQSSLINFSLRLSATASRTDDMVIAYNYVKVEKFKRYYFIDNWEYNADGTWTAYCSEDYLATWKKPIRESTGYIGRTSRTVWEFQNYIVDNLYPATNDFITNSVTADTGLSSNKSNGTFILGIINGTAPNVGAVSYYALTPSDLANLTHALVGTASTMFSDVENLGSDVVKSMVDPFQYITSCKWFPFTVSFSGLSNEAIKVGSWTASWSETVNGQTVTHTAWGKKLTNSWLTMSIYSNTSGQTQVINGSTYSRVALPTVGSGEDEQYPPYSPFAQYSLITAWGTFDIDPTLMVQLYQKGNSYIYYRIIVNFISGLGKFVAYAYPKRNNSTSAQMPLVELFKKDIEAGMDIPLSQVSYNYVQAGTGIMQAGTGIGQLIAKDIAGGISSLATGIGNAVQAAISPSVQTTSSPAAAFTPLIEIVTLQMVRHRAIDKSPTTFGIPFKSNSFSLVLSDWDNAYVQFDKAIFIGNDTTTGEEKVALDIEVSEVTSLLEKGVYLE